MKIYLDAENVISGRLASYTARELLKGHEVVIVNAEKALVSGSLKDNAERIQRLRRKKGSTQQGPKISKLPEKLLKRIVRGMLPWDKPKGREAFRRLRCYAGNPLNEEEKKKLKIIKTNLPMKYNKLEDIINLV